MKMENQDREKLRRRDGYKKIIKSCALAKGKYKWLWIDTCCIDKRNSAELSEAINSMYQWYQNSQVCYAYLHDVEATFPTEPNDEKFATSKGWPEWFARGWTLQELIAPKNVQFFNKDWVGIGNKRGLASTLEVVTGIPDNILKDGLLSKQRPSVAQVMSWAADRKTKRVEDRAYSLLGLLGVNMPMLYGEGEKAFRRLQLEVIRESNDQSIFAWDPDRKMPRYGSVLADDPSYFRDCHGIERVEFDKFGDELIKYIRQYNLNDPESRESELRGAAQQLHAFVVTNAGIQIQLPLIPYCDSPSTFKAILACRQYGNLVTVDLASRELTFDRSCYRTELCKTHPKFRSIYLTHSQDANEMQRRLMLDDRHASFYGFTRCVTYPLERVTLNIVTLSSLANDLVIVVYANGNSGSRFALGLGNYFGQGWVHVTSNEHPETHAAHGTANFEFAKKVYDMMWSAHAVHARDMPERHEVCDVYHLNTFIKHAHLPRSLYAAKVVWGRWDEGNLKVLVDVKQCPGCCAGPRKWTVTSNDCCLDMPGLMETGYPREFELELDGKRVRLGESRRRIALGDYGNFPNGRFERDGNIFEDLRARGIDCHPVVSRVSGDEDALHHVDSRDGIVVAFHSTDKRALYLPKGLLLPDSHQLVLLLKDLSTRLSGKHLVITVICRSDFYGVGCGGDRRSLSTDSELHHDNLSVDRSLFTPLCIVASPHVWREEPVSEQRRGQLENIRKHFYNLLYAVGTAVQDESARKQAVNFFSSIFGLENLKIYVGEITFFERLPSMMETEPISDASTVTGRQSLHCEVGLRPLCEKCNIINGEHETSYRYIQEKQEIESEVKSISETLGVGLVKLITTTFFKAYRGLQLSQTNQANVYRQANTCSMIQKIKELQVKLDEIEGGDKKRTLEEDLTGEILWLCFCGIHSEVEQTLPEVVSYIRREGQMKGLFKIAEIMKRTPHPNLEDNQIHLWRILADTGAGVSKHQLLPVAH